MYNKKQNPHSHTRSNPKDLSVSEARVSKEMIEYIALTLLMFGSLFLLLIIFFTRHWLHSAARSLSLHLLSLYTRRLHLPSDDSAHDVLIVFRDPTFCHVDLRPLLRHLERATVIEASINYALPLDMLGHALDAKQCILPHFTANPTKRYTFVGLGIGGYIAAYCAAAMPMETQTFSTTQFNKNRVRTLLVGTPTGGLRSLYNATVARFYLHPALRACLTPGSPENRAFWNAVGIPSHLYFLIAIHDFRAQPSRQTPPAFYTSYIEAVGIPASPWYGLLTEQRVDEALSYLWNIKHV